MAIAIWLLSGFQLMAAEDITARRISQALVIDGKLDEAAWQGAQIANKFTILGTTNASLYKTSAAVLYDDDDLPPFTGPFLMRVQRVVG